ncbi:Putative formamidase C869.04 [Linum grandiflorum]
MAPSTPRALISVDVKKKPWQQTPPLHNRWHPEIPPVDQVTIGEFFRVEMVDWTGGVVLDDDSAVDIKTIDLSSVHHLSGPIRVVDEDGVAAKPGDLLVVEICNLGPLPGDEWGYTATFDRENGGGFLTDHFPCATKAIWYFEGIFAHSPHIPGVRFPGLTHPGIVGTAPSKELLEIWNQRERDLEENGHNTLALCDVLHSRPLANLPSPKGCMLGKVYLLLSCCPCEGRISGIVDAPNACATLAIPTAIFDQDIRPKPGKVPIGPRVLRTPDVLKCSYDGNLPITKNPSAGK